MIGYLAPNDGNISRLNALDGKSVMSNSGANTGNLAFFYMGCRLIDGDVIHVTPSDPRLLDCKAIVIPAANWIGSHTDIGFLVKAIESVSCPIFVWGLGAQAEQEDQIPEIPEGTKQFLRALQEKKAVVGVRGEYSAKVLRHYGLDDFSVLGCPSLLMSPDKNLGEVIEARIANLKVENILVAGACKKGNLGSVERELYRLVKLNTGSAYLVQRPAEFVSLIMRDELNEEQKEYIRSFATFLELSGGFPELRSFLIEYGYVPMGIDSWSSYARRFSCAVNTRIHGTMVAFQSGVPSLCITHDTRTLELATRCKLPMVDVKGFIERRHNVRRLFASAGFEGKAFDENRRETAKQYADVVQRMGCTVSTHLAGLSQ